MNSGNEDAFDFDMDKNSTSKFNPQSSFLMESNIFDDSKIMEFMTNTIQSHENFRTDTDAMNFDFSFFPGQAENDNCFKFGGNETQNKVNFLDFGAQSKQSKCSNMEFHKSIASNFDSMFEELNRDQADSQNLLNEVNDCNKTQKQNINISMSGLKNLYDTTQKDQSNNTQELNAFDAQIKEMEQMLNLKSKADDKNKKQKLPEYSNSTAEHIENKVTVFKGQNNLSGNTNKLEFGSHYIPSSSFEMKPEENVKKQTPVNQNHSEFINKSKQPRGNEDFRVNSDNNLRQHNKNEALANEPPKNLNSGLTENLSIKIQNKPANPKTVQSTPHNSKQQDSNVQQKQIKKGKGPTNIKTKLECVEEAEEPYEELNEANKAEIFDFSQISSEQLYVENEKAKQFYDNVSNTMTEKKEWLKNLGKLFSSNLAILKKIEELDNKINERLIDSLERTCFLQKIYFNLVADCLKDKEFTTHGYNTLSKRAEAFFTM